MNATVERLQARDNPSLAKVRRLLRDARAYRRLGQVWLEGDHLLRAAVARGHRLDLLLWPQQAAGSPHLPELVRASRRSAEVADALWAELTQLETPSTLGALVSLPADGELRPGLPTLVLDRVQDPGNVGSMLRSASAFGLAQVVALKGTAALWAPKVLRAGMGAHFGLALFEAQEPAALAEMQLPLVATSSHGGQPLHRGHWPEPCAWVFGHEGEGIAPALLAQCRHRVAITQSGGEESLNVAAAAAICLHESQRRRLEMGSGPGQGADQ